jgi:hypothetical protein
MFITTACGFAGSWLHAVRAMSEIRSSEKLVNLPVIMAVVFLWVSLLPRNITRIVAVFKAGRHVPGGCAS